MDQARRPTGRRGQFGRRWSALAAVALLSASDASGRQGVGGSLPCETASKSALDAGDETQIRQHVAEAMRRFQSADPGESAAGREALVGPLSCAGITFAFRLKYSEVLSGLLAPLASGEDERSAANALVVLSRLRTSTAAEAMSPGLKSSSAVVRFAAASGFRRLFQELVRDSFGFNDAGIDRLLSQASAALLTEPDPAVADMLVLALGDGVRGQAGLRGRAALRLTESFAGRISSIRREGKWSEAWSAATLRALDMTRQTLFEQAGAGQIDKEFARRACLLSGQVFAVARDRMVSGTTDADLVRSVGAAEGLAVIAHNAAASPKLGEKGMQRLFEQGASGGNQQEFVAAAEVWIGRDGVLLKPPFNGQATDFAAVNPPPAR